jgi:hypothetical protein
MTMAAQSWSTSSNWREVVEIECSNGLLTGGRPTEPRVTAIEPLATRSRSAPILASVAAPSRGDRRAHR